MIFGLKAKLAVGLIALSTAFGSGWLVKGKFEDSKELASVRAQHSLASEIRQGQAEISKQVADRLSQLKANERIIDRGIVREIQKPVYQRVCFEPELVRLLNAAQRGEPFSGSTEPSGQVPGDPAGAQ